MSGPRHLWSGDWERESPASSDGTDRRPEHEHDGQAAATPPTDPPGTPNTLRNARYAAGATIVVLLIAVIVIIANSGGSNSASTPTTAAQLPPNGGQTAPNLTIPGLTSPNPTTPNPTTPTPATPSPGSTTGTSTTTIPAVAPQPVNWLGMEIITVPNGTAVVDTVTPGGAGDRAGLTPSDTITRINGHAVTGSASVAHAVAGVRKGATVTVTVDRGGTVLNLQATFTGPPTKYP